MKIEQILIDETDSNVYISFLMGKVCHVEQKTGIAMLPCVFTGWVFKGKFQIMRQDCKKKYINIQEVLK